jgi:hypothetical protein
MHLSGALAPQFGNRTECNLVVNDLQDSGFACSAADYESIVFGVTQLGSEETARVGISISAGERRLEGHVQAG